MRTNRFLLAVMLLLACALNASVYPLELQNVETEKRCELHGVSLVKGEAPIRYGMVIISDVYEKAKAKKFPHTNSHVEGGCEVWEGAPKTQGVSYCPRCRTVESEWLKKQREKEEGSQ